MKFVDTTFDTRSDSNGGDPDKKSKTASIVIITHMAKELNIQKCLLLFSKNKNIYKKPALIRLLSTWLEYPTV